MLFVSTKQHKRNSTYWTNYIFEIGLKIKQYITTEVSQRKMEGNKAYYPNKSLYIIKKCSINTQNIKFIVHWPDITHACEKWMLKNQNVLVFERKIPRKKPNRTYYRNGLGESKQTEKYIK